MPDSNSFRFMLEYWDNQSLILKQQILSYRLDKLKKMYAERFSYRSRNSLFRRYMLFVIFPRKGRVSIEIRSKEVTLVRAMSVGYGEQLGITKDDSIWTVAHNWPWKGQNKRRFNYTDCPICLPDESQLLWLILLCSGGFTIESNSYHTSRVGARSFVGSLAESSNMFGTALILKR